LYLAEPVGENIAEGGTVWCAKLSDFVDPMVRCVQYAPRTEHIRGSTYGK
jgi:hypothetical protein